MALRMKLRFIGLVFRHNWRHHGWKFRDPVLWLRLRRDGMS